MSAHFSPSSQNHPVNQLEPEVAGMFLRTMKRADAENRYLEPGEEINLTHMSVAVSLKRMADDYSKFVWALTVMSITGPLLALVYLVVLSLALMRLH